MTSLIASVILTNPIFVVEHPQSKSIPTFSLKASDGNTYTQASVAKKDTVIVFFSNGCPHNPKSAPDMNRLKAMFGTKVALIGMTNLDAAKAKAYAKELKLSFPLIADSKGETIEKFGGAHSLDIALINAKQKKVSKFWEGYDRTVISEMLNAIKSQSGTTIKTDLTLFPASRQSGCSF